MRTILLVLCGVMLAFGAVDAQAQDFSGRLTLTDDATESGFVAFNIWVDDYTENDERQQYLETLAEDGPEMLAAELASTQVGRFQVLGQLANRIAYAYEFPDADGGRRVLLATARPLIVTRQIPLGSPRDFPFGLIQLNLDENGEGDGVIFAATSIRFNDEGNLEVANSSTSQRFRIVTVRDR